MIRRKRPFSMCVAMYKEISINKSWSLLSVWCMFHPTPSPCLHPHQNFAFFPIQSWERVGRQNWAWFVACQCLKVIQKINVWMSPDRSTLTAFFSALAWGSFELANLGHGPWLLQYIVYSSGKLGGWFDQGHQNSSSSDIRNLRCYHFIAVIMSFEDTMILRHISCTSVISFSTIPQSYDFRFHNSTT